MTNTAAQSTTGDDDSIRPFSVEVSQSDVDDLRRRLQATRWPERETVSDQIAGRAAGHHPGARPLLGRRLRHAPVRDAG